VAVGLADEQVQTGVPASAVAGSLAELVEGVGEYEHASSRPVRLELEAQHIVPPAQLHQRWRGKGEHLAVERRHDLLSVAEAQRRTGR
jgi:hypothetical protein